MNVINVSGEAYLGEKGASFWRFDERVNFNTDLVLGMSPTNYHSFIICDDIEFHPRFSFNKTRIISRRKDTIRASAFVLLRGFQKEELLNFKKFLVNGQNIRHPSCHMGVVRMLERGLGLKMNQKNFRYSPLDFAKRCVSEQPWTYKKNLEYSFFLVKVKDTAQMLSEIGSFQKHFSWVYYLSDLYLYTHFWLPR